MTRPARSIAPNAVASGPGWVVLDKPPGLPVHAGPRGGDSIEARLPAWLGPHCQIRQPVHRLDADTSGCLLVATRRSVLRSLAADFAARRVGKLYIAIVDAVPDAERGRIDAPLAKTSHPSLGWRIRLDPQGQPAVTDWTLLATRERQALVALQPRTGRTHQLRLHAGLIVANAAVAGDPLYGRPAPRGLMLHALALAFTCPRTGGSVMAQTRWPKRFDEAGFTRDAHIDIELQRLLSSVASMESAIADGSSA